jgi:ferritin-like metal-binding protein YciE
LKIWTLFDAFRWEVSALSDGIQQFLEVREEMAACTSNPELARRLRRHLEQTEQQVMNLDQIAQMLGEQDLPVTNHAARGIAREVRDTVDAAQANHVRDWIITMAADTIERAAIARYTGLIAMARQLEMPYRWWTCYSRTSGRTSRRSTTWRSSCPGCSRLPSSGREHELIGRSWCRSDASALAERRS